jgi:purine nucleosidase
MNPLIIDTDPGVDDALAIAFAVKSGLPLIGITTVYGNASVANTTQNALTINQIMGTSCPVFQGAEKPLQNEASRAVVHGDNGLGGFSIPNLSRVKEEKTAEEFLNLTLSGFKGKPLDICCIGPLTNIARLSKSQPDLFDDKKRLIIMGGAVREDGNVTPYAEFNTYNDPYALKEVLNLACPKMLIPLEVCRKVVFTLEDFNNLNDQSMQSSFKKIADFYITSYMNKGTFTGFRGGVMYDLLTIAYMLKPEIFNTEPLALTVDLKRNRYFGRTKRLTSESPNCELAIDVNASKVKELFFNTMNTIPALT